MKRLIIIIILFGSLNLFSQTRSSSRTSMGITLGDPTGFTLKYITGGQNALNFNVGSSYFGKLRFGLDYLWYFKPFRSDNVAIHTGFGGVLGTGESNSLIFKKKSDKFYLRESGVGFGVRGLVGIDFYPNNSPFEIFFELGPLLGFTPNTGTALDLALGFRFSL